MTPVLAVANKVADLVEKRSAELGVPVKIARIGEDGRLLEPLKVDAILSSELKRDHMRALLREQPSVRWVAAQSAGVDGVLVPEVIERNVIITRSRHVHDTFVAEFAMALMLAACKSLRDAVWAQDRKEWLKYQPPSLAGQTLVIVGYGEIGRAIATRAKPFGMRIIGLRTRPRPDEMADEVWAAERLEEALSHADYAVLCVPGGGERRHMIADRQLRALPKHAYLINVARGELVDSDALDRVLRAEGFAGALLDTVEPEPLPQDSPLWTNPRVLITAHVAGVGGATFYGDVLEQIVENLRRFGAGEPLLNQVDNARGY